MGQPEEINLLGLEKGLFISIDSANSNPFSYLNNIIEISTGTETNIMIEKSIFDKYPKPYSDCKLDDTNIFQDINSKYYKQVMESNYSYSQSLCIKFCRHDLLSQTLSCKFRSSSIYVPGVFYCDPFQFNLEKYIKQPNGEFYNETNQSDIITNICIDLCPKECQMIKFRRDFGFVFGYIII